MAIKASGGAAGCTDCRQRAGSRSLPRRHWDDLTAEIADGHRKCIVVTHAKETINQKGRKRTYSATTCVEAASAEADIQIAQVAGHALHSAAAPAGAAEQLWDVSSQLLEERTLGWKAAKLTRERGTHAEEIQKNLLSVSLQILSLYNPTSIEVPRSALSPPKAFYIHI